MKTHETASPVLSIERHDEACDGIPVRRLRTERPMSVNGGVLEIEISDTFYMEDSRIPPSAIDLSLFHDEASGDRSLGTTIMPDELDDLITTLTALRDRARDVGILPTTLPLVPSR